MSDFSERALICEVVTPWLVGSKASEMKTNMTQIVVKSVIFIYFFSALLFGAKSQIVPLRFAKSQDRVFNCEYLTYIVRNTETPGWTCATVTGLSPAFVLICGVALFTSIAFFSAFSLPRSKINRDKLFFSRFTVGSVSWITAASGFTFMIRGANVALGRLNFDALLYPTLVLICSLALLLYLSRNLDSLW